MYDEGRKTDVNAKKLLVAVPTRWHSNYNSLSSVSKARYVLLQLCNGKQDELKGISPTVAPSVIKIVQDVSFWNKLSDILKLIEFPVNIIGKVEADNAELPLVYEYFQKLFGHFKENAVVLAKVQKRWDFIKRDVHYLSFMLTPKHASSNNFIEEKAEEMSKIKGFVAVRSPATVDEAARQMIQYVGHVSSIQGDYKEMIDTMKATDYWSIEGKHKYPQLHSHAKTISSMTCSSAAAERVWSIFGFIHNQLRNRLANDKVEKLVFLYVNAGILDEKDSNDYILEYLATLNEDDFDENMSQSEQI